MFERIYSWLLRAYPREFREEYEVALRQAFRDQLRDAVARRQVLRFWLSVLIDWSKSAAIPRAVPFAPALLTLVSVHTSLFYCGRFVLVLLYPPGHSRLRMLAPLPWPWSFAAEMIYRSAPDAAIFSLFWAAYLTLSGRWRRLSFVRSLAVAIFLLPVGRSLLEVLLSNLGADSIPLEVEWSPLLMALLIAMMVVTSRASPRTRAPEPMRPAGGSADGSSSSQPPR